MPQALGLVSLALALGAMAACGGARPSKYYQLEVPAMAPQAGGSTPYPVALLVGNITAPHLYRDERIVYRTRGEELGTYQYHRWAAPPTEMLESMLLRMLRASGHFRTVQMQRSNARGDYIVRGRLSNFEEVNSGALKARVVFEIELYEIKTGTTVWSHFYSRDEPVSGKQVSDVVAALNRNTRQGLEQVVAGMEEYFASHPPK